MESPCAGYRVPASWITVQQPNGTVEYYELDHQGDLICTNGRLVPYCICFPPSRCRNSNINYDAAEIDER